MSFFDSLERFVSDLQKSLKPEEVVKLKSCKKCSYYKKGYCTQTPVPTRILSEYWAQGCLFFSPQETVVATPRKIEVGQQIQLSGLHWYDRNPQSKSFSKGYLVSPHEATKRTEYGCPEGKIAMVELLQCSNMRYTVATEAGAVNTYWYFVPIVPPEGDSTTDIMLIAEFLDNIVGSKVPQAIGTTFTMYAGDKLVGVTADASTGGTVLHRLAYKLTEFDV